LLAIISTAVPFQFLVGVVSELQQLKPANFLAIAVCLKAYPDTKRFHRVLKVLSPKRL
jgi:hypothetical protein